VSPPASSALAAVSPGTNPGAPPRAAARPARRSRRRRISTPVELGIVTIYLSLLVVIPLAAVVLKGFEGGWSQFWAAITGAEAWATLKLTILLSLAVGLINAVTGTLIAWVLVRDRFPGKRIIDALIDLPFALPTIVAGLVLLTLYGPQSPIGLSLAYTRVGVLAALLFVTLPFVVRTVQPVLYEFDTQMEEAAASLGASRIKTFRRIVLPNLFPAIVAGTALSFARALSEFGSTVLISGNIPFQTQVASVHIYNQIQSDNTVGAAAVATVLLVVALLVLVALTAAQRWVARRG
jgi:sulfate transport system permease protein